MPEKKERWFQKWFNEDYLKLYAYRDPKEAAEHVEFLVKALELNGNESILDLACGTGRHVQAFAERGFDVTGVDLSSYLIKKGQESLNSTSIRAKLLVGDMFHLKNLSFFDLVISIFTSFGYFAEDEKNARVFGVVQQHLKTGGKFFLDHLHPAEVIRNLKKYEVREIDGEKVEIFKRIEGDRVIKTIIFANPYRKYQEKVKLYSKEKIEEMLRAYSFQVIAVWNDYQGNPWRPDGDRQLFYCRAEKIKASQ